MSAIGRLASVKALLRPYPHRKLLQKDFFYICTNAYHQRFNLVFGDAASHVKGQSSHALLHGLVGVALVRR